MSENEKESTRLSEDSELVAPGDQLTGPGKDNSTLQDLLARTRQLTVVPVWPDAARLLGVGRTAAYEAARSGQIPTIRIGRKILVPVARLFRLLGIE